MHRDFHLYGTYLAARLSGYDIKKSQKIAWAAQAVSDYTYGEYASCQEFEDFVKNDNEILKTYWSVFHFLPGGNFDGNINTTEKEYETKPFGVLYDNLHNTLKLDTSGDSWLAKAGVTMHVLADTYLNEGLSGIPIIKNTNEEIQFAPEGLLCIGTSVLKWLLSENIYFLKSTKNEKQDPNVFAVAFIDIYETLGGSKKKSNRIFEIIKAEAKSLEENRTLFSAYLFKSRFHALIKDMKPFFEKEQLETGYELYIGEVNKLSKDFIEVNDKRKQTEFWDKLYSNDFYAATIWHRKNVLLAMLGLLEK